MTIICLRIPELGDFDTESTPARTGFLAAVLSPNSTWFVTSRLDTTRHVRRVERVETSVSGVSSRDVHGNEIPNGNPTGMGIKHSNGNGREWQTRSMGMGITCTPMGMHFHGNILLIAANGHILMFCIINNSKSTISLTLLF